MVTFNTQVSRKIDLGKNKNKENSQDIKECDSIMTESEESKSEDSFSVTCSCDTVKESQKKIDLIKFYPNFDGTMESYKFERPDIRYPWEEKKLLSMPFPKVQNHLNQMKERYRESIGNLREANDKLLNQNNKINQIIPYFERLFLERRQFFLEKKLQDMKKNCEKKMYRMNKIATNYMR